MGFFYAYSGDLGKEYVYFIEVMYIFRCYVYFYNNTNMDN